MKAATAARLSIVIFLATFFSSCAAVPIVTDHRKPGSTLRKQIDRTEHNGTQITAVMLMHTPLGTSRDDVHDFLVENLKKSAGTRIVPTKPIKPHNRYPRGHSRIFSELWVRHYGIVGEVTMNLRYIFDKNQRLIELYAYQGDAFW